MTKFTSDDIKRLAGFIRHAKDLRPFSLLTGAGCSKLAGIPLAGELVREILDSARYAPHISKLTAEERAKYGRLMACLGKNDRKDLLGKYLNEAKVNWAHIAIASMMSAGYVAKTLTFNFDNVLARACGICGLYPSIYDFVTGASSTTDHIVSPAIIHLHGQGHGLAMLNSEQETKDHAERLRPLLRNTLHTSPVLVVGYSGLADEVFPIIRDEFDGNEHLFWAGFGDEPEPHISQLARKHPQLTEFLGGCEADILLVQLARELGCWPPTIFENPIGHIRNEIGPVAQFPIGGNSQTGVDVLEALRSKLSGMERGLARSDPELSASLSLLKGDFAEVDDASERGEEVAPNIRFAALFSQAYDLASRAEATGDVALFDAAIEKYAAALMIRPYDHEALNNWGNVLSDKAKATGDAALFDAAFEKYAAALTFNPHDHNALNNLGVSLSDKAKATGDAALFDAALEKFAAALAIEPDKSEALNNWGVALLGKAEATGDATLFDAAFEKYAAALAVKAHDHQVLNNWGIALLGKANATGDVALFDAAFEKYAAALAIKPDNSEVLNNWGIALSGKAEAIGDATLFDAAFEKYAAALAVTAHDHEVLNNWAIALSGKAKATGDIALFDAAGEKYAAALEIKPHDHQTLSNWGTTLLDKVKATGDAALFDAAGEKYAAALAIKPGYAYNMACLSAMRSDAESARKHLETCTKENTLPSRMHLETDSDLDFVRNEEWFRELVERHP